MEPESEAKALKSNDWNAWALPVGTGLFTGLFVVLITLKPLIGQYGVVNGAATGTGLGVAVSLVTTALCRGMGRLLI